MKQTMHVFVKVDMELEQTESAHFNAQETMLDSMKTKQHAFALEITLEIQQLDAQHNVMLLNTNNQMQIVQHVFAWQIMKMMETEIVECRAMHCSTWNTTLEKENANVRLDMRKAMENANSHVTRQTHK